MQCAVTTVSRRGLNTLSAVGNHYLLSQASINNSQTVITPHTLNVTHINIIMLVAPLNQDEAICSKYVNSFAKHSQGSLVAAMER